MGAHRQSALISLVTCMLAFTIPHVTAQLTLSNYLGLVNPQSSNLVNFLTGQTNLQNFLIQSNPVLNRFQQIQNCLAPRLLYTSCAKQIECRLRRGEQVCSNAESVIGCYCAPGTAELSSGLCVSVFDSRCLSESLIPSVTNPVQPVGPIIQPSGCPPFSYVDTDLRCENTCFTTYNEGNICNEFGRSGCRCNLGLVKYQNQCISPSECPTGPSTGLVDQSSTCNPGCLNGGLCRRLSSGQYACQCFGGYTGPDCNDRGSSRLQSTCNPSCVNGGQCLLQSSGYYCQCPSGYEGVDCSRRRQVVVVSTPRPVICNPPCRNSGTCTLQSTGSATCRCPSPYTGADCSTLITATNPPTTRCLRPCRNGGLCEYQRDRTYRCICPPTHTGVDCSQRQQPILPPVVSNPVTTGCEPPCQNGGNCVLQPNGGYGCRCTSFYTGPACSEVNRCGTCPQGTQCRLTQAFLGRQYRCIQI